MILKQFLDVNNVYVYVNPAHVATVTVVNETDQEGMYTARVLLANGGVFHVERDTLKGALAVAEEITNG